MAKAIFAGCAGFQYHAEVRPLHTPHGEYSLSILTTWAEAKAPEAERQVFQVATDAEGLQALSGLLSRALDKSLADCSTAGSDLFLTDLRRIFQEHPGTGSFSQPNTTRGGSNEPHRFSWATGMGSTAAAHHYQQRFGPVPEWLGEHHPSHRRRACDLARRFGQALPDQFEPLFDSQSVPTE